MHRVNYRQTSDSDEERPGRRPVVALSGASGYIGRNLLEALTAEADVIALSRNGDERQDTDTVTWRSCDFYAAEDAVSGLAGADYAVFLLHSMLPSAKLTQGTFQDMDVILATHFARAAQKNGIRQIVYLSGMIPPDTTKDELSRHLRSRLEVEEILGSTGVPVTTIRAGLIVGPQGSSFPILAKLVRRLPFMILPRWTRTRTHPVALAEVVEALRRSIGCADLEGRVIDVGGPDVHRVEGLSEGSIPFREAALQALEEERKSSNREEQGRSKQPRSDAAVALAAQPARAVADVRSVQRLILPPGKDAAWAGDYYVQWLARFAGPVFRAERKGEISRLYLLGFRKPLLQLTYDAEGSDPGYACYRISGGSFAKLSSAHRGRLEFVQIEGTRECVVAIHDYVPSLPWIVYRYSQAKLHLLVMWLYRRHLSKVQP